MFLNSFLALCSRCVFQSVLKKRGMRKLNFWYRYVPSVFPKDLEKAFEIWAHQRCYTFVVGSGSAYKAKNSKLFKGLECLSENCQDEIFNFV